MIALETNHEPTATSWLPRGLLSQLPGSRIRDFDARIIEAIVAVTHSPRKSRVLIHEADDSMGDASGLCIQRLMSEGAPRKWSMAYGWCAHPAVCLARQTALLWPI